MEVRLNVDNLYLCWSRPTDSVRLRHFLAYVTVALSGNASIFLFESITSIVSIALSGHRLAVGVSRLTLARVVPRVVLPESSPLVLQPPESQGDMSGNGNR